MKNEGELMEAVGEILNEEKANKFVLLTINVAKHE